MGRPRFRTNPRGASARGTTVSALACLALGALAAAGCGVGDLGGASSSAPSTFTHTGDDDGLGDAGTTGTGSGGAWTGTPTGAGGAATTTTPTGTGGAPTTTTPTGAGGSAGAGGAPAEPDAGPTGIFGLNGPVVPCQGDPRPPNTSGKAIDWAALPATGSIGTNSAGQDMLVFVRDACPGQSPVRTVVIGASIHASEIGGQTVAHELLFNKPLPPDVRIIAIPEINKAGLTGKSPSPRVNANGVNLNRNFDYEWDKAKQGDADANNPNFKGPSPASEPETQAIQAFLGKVGTATLVLSYHRNLNWVAPSGPNAGVSRPLSVLYGKLAKHPVIYNNYGYGFFESWYAAETGTPALLVELSSSTAYDYLNRHADAVVGLLAP